MEYLRYLGGFAAPCLSNNNEGRMTANVIDDRLPPTSEVRDRDRERDRERDIERERVREGE
jgi:hypothetical protein